MTLDSTESLGLPGRYTTQLLRTFLLTIKHRSQERTTQLPKQLGRFRTLHRQCQLVLSKTIWQWASTRTNKVTTAAKHY